LALLSVFACSGADDRDWFVSLFFAGEERSWVPYSELSTIAPTRIGDYIYEMTRYPESEPSPEQRAAADELVRRGKDAARRNNWHDFEQASRDGFYSFGDAIHFVNKENVFDDRLLDPDHPEFLIYYQTEQGRRLAGFMFYVVGAGDHGPQLGGPLTVWHYHVWNKAHCLVKGLLGSGLADSRARCAQGEPSYYSPEMIHVWIIDRSEGPFHTGMNLSPADFRLFQDPSQVASGDSSGD
jgi:hypothetical protein